MADEQKKFLFDVSVTFIESIINVIIAIPTTIILGRYLGAGDLGLYRMAFTLYGITLLFADLGVPSAIIKYVSELNDDFKEVNRIISTSLFISLFFGFIFFILFFSCAKFIGIFFKMDELSGLVKIISFALTFSIIEKNLYATLSGFRKMKKRAKISIFRNIVQLLCIGTFIFLGYGISYVTLSILISSIVACSCLFWTLRNHFVLISPFVLLSQSKKLISFGIKTVVANAMNLINYQADTLMIGYFLTKSDVGFYTISITFAKLLWVIPSSIQKVTFPMISEYYGKKMDDEINKTVLNIMKYTTCIVILLGVIIIVFSKTVITLIYGESFIRSIYPLHILIMGTMVYGTIKSVNTIFASIGKVNLFARVPTISAIFNIILNFLLIPYYGIYGAAIATTVSLMAYFAIMIYYMKKLLKLSFDTSWYLKIGSIPLAILPFTIFFIEPIQNLFLRSLLGIILITIIFSFMWASLMTPYERKIFSEKTRLAFNSLKGLHGKLSNT